MLFPLKEIEPRGLRRNPYWKQYNNQVGLNMHLADNNAVVLPPQPYELSQSQDQGLELTEKNVAQHQKEIQHYQKPGQGVQKNKNPYQMYTNSLNNQAISRQRIASRQKNKFNTIEPQSRDEDLTLKIDSDTRNETIKDILEAGQKDQSKPLPRLLTINNVMQNQVTPMFQRAKPNAKKHLQPLFEDRPRLKLQGPAMNLSSQISQTPQGKPAVALSQPNYQAFLQHPNKGLVESPMVSRNLAAPGTLVQNQATGIFVPAKRIYPESYGMHLGSDPKSKHFREEMQLQQIRQSQDIISRYEGEQQEQVSKMFGKQKPEQVMMQRMPLPKPTYCQTPQKVLELMQVEKPQYEDPIYVENNSNEEAEPARLSRSDQQTQTYQAVQQQPVANDQQDASKNLPQNAMELAETYDQPIQQMIANSEAKDIYYQRYGNSSLQTMQPPQHRQQPFDLYRKAGTVMNSAQPNNNDNYYARVNRGQIHDLRNRNELVASTPGPVSQLDRLEQMPPQTVINPIAQVQSSLQRVNQNNYHRESGRQVEQIMQQDFDNLDTGVPILHARRGQRYRNVPEDNYLFGFPENRMMNSRNYQALMAENNTPQPQSDISTLQQVDRNSPLNFRGNVNLTPQVQREALKGIQHVGFEQRQPAGVRQQLWAHHYGNLQGQRALI